MKLLIVVAALAACRGDKLDRTYLPPAGAKSAGGTDLQAPLAAPAGRPAFDGVAVDAAAADPGAAPPGAAPYARLSTGLGASPGAYGSSDSRVGDAAFRGASQHGDTEQTYGGVAHGFRGAPERTYSGTPQQSFDGGFENIGAPQRRNEGGRQQSVDAKGQNYGGSQLFGQQFGADINSEPLQRRAEPERPQASQERAAGIVRLDSDVTADGFAYSFETDNGIAAEENALAANGVQAQGAFSYRGDDGETYSVSYTADERGYRPQGAHLPTPPPIPDDILRSIERNMEDEAAGIIDDGAYDAQKHGGGQYDSVEGAAGFARQPAQYDHNGAGAEAVRQFGAASHQALQTKGSYLPPGGSFESSSQQYTNSRQGPSSQFPKKPTSQTSQFDTQQFNPILGQEPSQKYSSMAQQSLPQQYQPNTQKTFQQPNSLKSPGYNQQNQALSQQRYSQPLNAHQSQDTKSQESNYPTAQGPLQLPSAIRPQGQYHSSLTQLSNSNQYNIPSNQGLSQQPNFSSTKVTSKQPNAFKSLGQFDLPVTHQRISQQYKTPSNQEPVQEANFPASQSSFQQNNQQYKGPAQPNSFREPYQQLNTPTNPYSAQSNSQQFVALASPSQADSQAYSNPPQSSPIGQFSKTQSQQYTFQSGSRAQISAQSPSRVPQPNEAISELTKFDSPAQNFNEQSQKFTASSNQFKSSSQPTSPGDAYHYNPPAKSFNTPQQLNVHNNRPFPFNTFDTASQGGPTMQRLTAPSRPTGSSFQQPLGPQSTSNEESSAPSQQYDGEIYQYNKPEDSPSSSRPRSGSSGVRVPSESVAQSPSLAPSQSSSQRSRAQTQPGGHDGGGGGIVPDTTDKEDFGGQRAPPSFSAQSGYHY